MAEDPASYRPNPKLKRIERGFESLLFNSRWLMAPFYLGLVVSLAVLLLKFCMLLWEFIIHAPGSKESDIILGVLSLIDVSLTVSPIYGDDGRVVGASKIARDITERKRAQEQQKLLLGKSCIASRIPWRPSRRLQLRRCAAPPLTNVMRLPPGFMR